MVSVDMITYNHEAYIKQAIEGVLMQKTNFKFELVIGEDCSTDRTREICIEYQKKYPDIIKLLLPEKNLGMNENGIRTVNACSGKYIALCEGDDYWTDPLKLQKQVDFLEGNEEYSICFHPVKVWKENEKELVDDFITREVPETTTILDLAEGNYIHTPSVVFRKNQEVFDTFQSLGALPVGDYVLHMLNAKYGMIKKLPEIMGVYRVHDGGVHSFMNNNQKKLDWIVLLDKISDKFDEEVNDIFKEVKINIFEHVMYDLHLFNQSQKNILLGIAINNENFLMDRFSELKQLRAKTEQLEKDNQSIKKTFKRFISLIIIRLK